MTPKLTLLSSVFLSTLSCCEHLSFVSGFRLVTPTPPAFTSQNTRRVHNAKKCTTLRQSLLALDTSEEEILSTSGRPTDLPDSLDDAAELAAQACVQFTKMTAPNSGMNTRCRVDFDTSMGDETYTTLKSSTEFMQKFTSALCYAMIPGSMENKQDQMMAVAQAKVELSTMMGSGAGIVSEEQEGEEETSEPSPNADRVAELKEVCALQWLIVCRRSKHIEKSFSSLSCPLALFL